MPLPVVSPASGAVLIGYGDVEQTLVDYLRLALSQREDGDGVTVGTRLEGTPGRFVLIRRVGGIGPRPGVDLARIDVQVWHETETRTHDLAAVVRALLHTARGTGTVRGVRDSAGPVAAYDTDNKQPRYLLTVDITLKGVPL